MIQVSALCFVLFSLQGREIAANNIHHEHSHLWGEASEEVKEHHSLFEVIIARYRSPHYYPENQHEERSQLFSSHVEYVFSEG